jgi:catechol 2,3-dioxygenase-like lactoylglutathione lyase family enzyme
MNIRIAHITLLVDDYDKAIDFFTRKLNFKLVEDTKLSDEKRWVLVKPQGSENCCLLLAKASNDEQKRSIGHQSGGRVFLFLQTDNFRRDYQNLIDNGIRIVREPKSEDYGTVAVFEDLYGNLWDLIEPRAVIGRY